MANGLIFDIRRHSLHDGPGIRTSLFLKGCPLACLWCHNPEGLDFNVQVQERPERCISCNSCRPTAESRHQPGARLAEACPTGALETIGQILDPITSAKLVLADSCFYGADGGVTFTGGEPLAQPEYLLATMQACRDQAIHVALDTSGYADSRLAETSSELCHLVLFDIKHMDAAKHRKLTGVSNAPILNNLQLFAASDVDLLISLPLIPGINDDESNLRETARCVASLKSRHRAIPRVRILPYHSAAIAKYQRLGLDYQCKAAVEPSAAQLGAALKIFQEYHIPCSLGGLA